MQLLDSKSILAKLMATENIHIEQRNVQTASFDVKNRILTVPVLDSNISGFQYDLFMGHEVGHALYTPLEGMLKAKTEKINRSLANILEDVRIEKKIKYKYPGLRTSFVKAYNELFEKNFFNTKGADLNKMNFIDRVNLYSKVGVSTGIKFTEAERNLLNEIESTESYDDVLRVCKKVQEYMEEQFKEEEERKAKMPQFEEEDDDEPTDNFDNSIDDWDDSDLDDGAMENDDDGPSTGSDKKDGEEEDKKPPSFEQPSDEDPIRSYTDESFKENEKKLFAENAKDRVYVKLPKVKTSEAIMDYKAFYKKWKEYILEGNPEFVFDLSDFQKLRKESDKVVGYLAKEFELRKNAEQLKRASTAKTGDLNMSKIFSYQFNEDIFKKITVVPGGKSHGLVMFLDWSGSMTDHLENTVKQLISLVMFCKKVNIPYEVYAFANSDEPSLNYTVEPQLGELKVGNFTLFNLLSSRMSANEFNFGAGVLLRYLGQSRGYYRPRWMDLSGTPLNEAVVAAMEIIPEFQKKYKLQIVNTVFLTDGEGHELREYYSGYSEEYKRMYTNNVSSSRWSGAGEIMVLTDPVTKHEEVFDSTEYGESTGHFVKMLKARTGCNVVGFYIISGRDFNRRLNNFYPKSVNFYEKKMEFRKNKFAVIQSAGFDEYYVLRSESLDTEEDNQFVVKENATTRGLVNAFSKYAGGRLANRIVLNKFIGQIS